MARAPSTNLAALPFASILPLIQLGESVTDRTPKEWFDRARHEADLAVLAERKGKREDMFVAYSRCCAAYTHAKMHPDFKEVKRADAHWAGRIKDFQETYEAYLHKAKELKEVLKQREIEKGDDSVNRPTPSRAPSTGGPEVSSMGSIADRMKALNMKGMDVGPSKRQSSVPPPQPQLHSPTRNRASSNASSSTSAEKPATRPRGPSIPPKPTTHSLPKIMDGLPAPATPAPVPALKPAGPRSRAGSKATDPETPAPEKVPPPIAPKPNLPSAPTSPTSPKLARQPSLPPPSPQAPEGNNTLLDFERNFPSLSEFGKQFEEAPSISVHGVQHDEPEETFPDLPSVPSSHPGPQPRADDAVISPPLAPPKSELSRPASTPNVASLPDEKPEPPPSLRPAPPPRVNGAGAKEPLALPPKPNFPLTNAIEPDVLRSYILNPSVDLLLLDVRSEDQYKLGYVGSEYEPKGYDVKAIWVDPTVLLRSDMNSTRLEDSLSLLPEKQRYWFQHRDKCDIVVVYDATSTSWPKSNSGPTPLSRLWDIIYEHEFSKRLKRNPVVLVGGAEHWSEYVRRRQMRHPAQGTAANAPVKEDKKPNGVGLPSSPRPPDRVVNGEYKRANRDVSVYQSSQYAKPEPPPTVPFLATAPPPLTRRHSPSASLSYTSPSISPPPQASLYSGPNSLRRSDYVDHSSHAYSGYTSPHQHPAALSPRGPIDYPAPLSLGSATQPPNASASRAEYDTRGAVVPRQSPSLPLSVTVPVPQPPQPSQSHSLERYDARPSIARSESIRALDLMSPQGDEVRYWNDQKLGMTGLKNLGNTCYMNSTLQCLSATFPFSQHFLDGRYRKAINFTNPLGTKGNLANAFAELLSALWKVEWYFLSPITFRKNIITFASQFSGTDQHDAQEFLSFVLDGLHEDLNRVKQKPPPVDMTPEREARLETLPPEIAAESEWEIYKQRNDSFIVDLFQGQYRNRLECLTCHKTSTTYDAFMYMSLPVPSAKKPVVVQELIDEFTKAEIMEKEDAWNCPRCKTSRRATKTLSISRLPPILLIQLKRFTTKNGVFWDKSETPVIFPIKGLDLTRYVPVRRAGHGVREDPSDPRTQGGRFGYDLYGVINHMGTLSSGHYTAYVKSSEGWKYCEDSKITDAQEKDVVSRPAYILFYKRVPTP